MAERVGIVGLGNMGGAFAENLIKHGFEVYGYDPLENCCTALREAGGEVKPLGELAENCGVILLSLPSVQALEEVLAVLVRAAAPGTIVAEASTFPVEDKVRLKGTLEGSGIILLDTPVSGNGAQARVGDLAVFLSGDEAACHKIIPVLQGFSRSQTYLGAFGNGMKMKCAANLMGAIHNVAAAEGLLLAVRSGLPAQLAYDVLVDSGATSRMLEVRGPMMVEGNFHGPGITTQLFLKDLSLILDAVKANGLSSPAFEATLPLYQEAARSHPEEDTASVYAVLDAL